MSELAEEARHVREEFVSAQINAYIEGGREWDQRAHDLTRSRFAERFPLLDALAEGGTRE